MGQREPTREFFPAAFGGVLDESKTPRKVGAGLTAANNVMHRRSGAWAKRPGSAKSYGFGSSAGPIGGAPSSGVRWYRGYPTPLTQTIVAAQGALWKAGDPGGTFTQIATFPGVSSTPVRFCSARDPLALSASGSDVLIMTGLSGAYGFATETCTLTFSSYVYAAGTTITVTLKNTTTGFQVVTPTYTVLPNDNLASIAAEMVTLINATAACVNGGNGTITGGPSVPFMNQAISAVIPLGATSGTFQVAALASGTAGNAYQVEVTISLGMGASGFTAAPSSLTNLAGGGTKVSNPLKWDGTTLSGLSPWITNPFTGCASWHSHVWFFGDPANPDTVFATDINTAEGWSFMTANGGGGSTGGYDVGAGDGDAFVRALLPIGNLMYVFKGAHIHAFTGYDFQSGEYTFSLEPAIAGHGTPYQECVTRLGNAAVFWDGARFLRLQVGAYDVEPIGSTIPFTSGRISKGNQSLMRCVAGDFAINMSPLDGNYTPPAQSLVPEVLQQVALFAVDVGNGIADTVLFYDDTATQTIGEYAWQPWTGWTVGAFIPFTKGENSAQSIPVEPAYLFWIPSSTGAPLVANLFGASPNQDSSVGIPWSVQTGWLDLGATPAERKNVHKVHVEIEATPGVALTGNVIKGAPLVIQPLPSPPTPPVGGYTSTTIRPLTFGATTGTPGVEAFQEVVAQCQPYLAQASAVMLQLSEPGTASSFEVTGALIDNISEALRP